MSEGVRTPSTRDIELVLLLPLPLPRSELEELPAVDGVTVLLPKLLGVDKATLGVLMPAAALTPAHTEDNDADDEEDDAPAAELEAEASLVGRGNDEGNGGGVAALLVAVRSAGCAAAAVECTPSDMLLAIERGGTCVASAEADGGGLACCCSCCLCGCKSNGSYAPLPRAPCCRRWLDNTGSPTTSAAANISLLLLLLLCTLVVLRPLALETRLAVRT
jgi:hypothetical protein